MSKQRGRAVAKNIRLNDQRDAGTAAEHDRLANIGEQLEAGGREVFLVGGLSDDVIADIQKAEHGAEPSSKAG